MSEVTYGVACPRCQVEGHTGEPLGQYIVTYAECPVCRADNLASRLSAALEERDAAGTLAHGLEADVTDLQCDLNDARSRLDCALEALTQIDRMDPRYDANEVHHASRTGRGWTWIAERQVWLNEKGEDMARGRDYGWAVEKDRLAGFDPTTHTLKINGVDDPPPFVGFNYEPLRDPSGEPTGAGIVTASVSQDGEKWTEVNRTVVEKRETKCDHSVEHLERRCSACCVLLGFVEAEG